MSLDEQIFYFIHHELANPVLDAVLPIWREKTTWVPAYLAAAVWLIWKYRWNGFYLLLAIGIGITLADQLTSSVIKPWVARPRPCYAELFAGQIRALVGCGGHDSFPSSHAANHFALATMLNLSWLKNRPRWQWLLLGWAASISLAQVYVAKHYPLDILVGGMLGVLIGWLVIYLLRKWKLWPAA